MIKHDVEAAEASYCSRKKRRRDFSKEKEAEVASYLGQ